MKFEIYEKMADLHTALMEVKERFEKLNDKEATWAWKFDEMKMAERLFTAAMDNIERLETFFCEGDELLPEEERERLEREQLEELIAEEMLEG